MQAFPELTVRISPTKYLVPDVVMATDFPGPYPTDPVQLCCEILSPEDRLGAMLGTTDQQLLAKYDEYGKHLGTAGQLLNDLRDTLDTTTKTDLQRKKKTLPLLIGGEPHQQLSSSTMISALDVGASFGPGSGNWQM